MAFKKNSPGCNASPSGCGCSTPTCEIGSDEFDRADSASLGSDWSEETPDLEIFDNTLTTATDGARAIHQTPAAAGVIPVRGQVRAKGEVDGDKARLIIKWLNSSNFWYLEVPFGTSKTVAIKKVVSGSTTTLVSSTLTTEFGTWYTLSLCYGNSKITGGVVGFDVLQTTITTDIDDQLYAGVWAAVSGSVTFDSFYHEYAYSEDKPTCPSCGGEESDCLECCEGASTDTPTFEVTIDLGDAEFSRQTCSEGVGPRVDCANGECEAIGGEYVLDLLGSFLCESVPTSCPSWAYEEIFCTHETPGNTLCIDSGRAGLCISAAVEFDEVLGKCRWFVSITIGDAAGASFQSHGFYRTPAGDDSIAPCSPGTYTLELDYAEYTPIVACQGSFPPTITLTRL